MIKVPNNVESKVLSFVRENGADKVFGVFNFSDETQNVEFKETLYQGKYQDYMAEEMVDFTNQKSLSIEPWGFRVFVK
jgi:hypothetical protein